MMSIINSNKMTFTVFKMFLNDLSTIVLFYETSAPLFLCDFFSFSFTIHICIVDSIFNITYTT